MSKPFLTRNGQGSIVLNMPAGEFRWRGGGWTVTHPMNRTTLNMFVNYCKARQHTMTKEQIMESLTDTTVLGTLFPTWNVAPVRNSPAQVRAGDKVKLGQKPYWGNGVVKEVRKVKAVVQFEFYGPMVLVRLTSLEKI